MRTSARRPAPLAPARALVVLAALAALVGRAPAARAQVEVDGQTEVRSIDFSGVTTLSARTLRETMRTRPWGTLHGLQTLLGKLPLVPGPKPQPFSPAELQRDVVRMRRAYAQAGFPEAAIRYDVRHDEKKNVLDITFVVEEGPPLILSAFRVAASDSAGPLPFPPGQQGSWDALVEKARSLEGERLDVPLARARGRQLRDWWRDRGFARARLVPRVERDTIAHTVDVRLEVLPGRPARYGDITIEGNDALAEGAILRQLGFGEGEVYSASALEEAERDVQTLAIVRFADADVPILEPRDSTSAPGAPVAVAGDSVEILPVRIRIKESKPHFTSAELGYVSDGGLSVQSNWEHYNFTGGGRSLTVAASAQTGWLAPAATRDRRYRISTSLEQPGFLLRRASGLISPFAEARDDERDRSTQYGLNGTIVYRQRAQRTLSLDYQIARRHVSEHRFAVGPNDLHLFEVYGLASESVLDSIGTRLATSTLTLSGSWGSLDDEASPRRGLLFRPAIRTTVPAAWSSVAYWRIDGTAYGFLPLGSRFTIATRASAGRLFPTGKSVPGEGADPRVEFFRLRDASFSAGGANDVRGWADRQLGPKIPDVRFDPSGDSLVLRTNGYDPLGGFSRLAFSTELQMPFPGFGPRLGTHVFLDAGRIWTEDTRFDAQGDALGQEKMFFATGAGIDWHTPVGAIKFDLGYKLNPSLVDLVPADQLLRAIAGEVPLEQVERQNRRRLQWHLSLGARF
jgi:outer membrane protein assembly factor BamA